MLILKSLLIIFCFLHLAFYPPYLDQADASTSTLTFEITWNGKATDKVTIKETLTGLQNLLNISGEVDFSFFRVQFGSDMRNNIVGEITVNNENGASLSFRKTETEGGDLHWLISPGNSEKVIVSYEIAFKYKNSWGYFGAVLDNLLCATLEATFIVPSSPSFEHFPFEKGDIKIKFNTPSSLNVYTPWDFDGVYYYIWHQAGNDLETWRTHYLYYSFMSDSFAVGEFWENSESVNGLDFVVIVSKLIPNLEQSDINKIYDLSKDCLEYMSNVWGKSVGTKYLITYLPYHPDGNRIYLSEASASQGFTLLYDHGTIYMALLVHQMGHRWDGFKPFGLNMDWGDFSYYNFREGGTVYYEIKAGANTGYYRPIESEIHQYETIRGTPRDKPIALVHWSGDPDEETIFYRKSALVYYLLDKEIQTKTNHRKSLDDVSKGIFLEHGVYPGHMNTLPLTMTGYIEMVNNITGYDFHSFFDYYYYSVGDINISADLTSDPDGNGLTIYQEVLLNYKPGVPKPNFNGSPTSGPAPLTVNFTDLSTGSISSWLWDFGDSTTSSIKNPSHTYNSEGVYTVSLTVTGSGGSDTKMMVSYIVVRQETISAPSTPSGPSNGTTGRSFNYTTGDSSSSLLHSLEYRFDWGDGTYSGWSSSSSASKSWSLFGSYTVKAQARCATDTSVVSDWSSGLTVNIMVPITLQSPSNNASLGACSLYSPPSFSWTPGEAFRSYQIQFSPDGSFSSTPLKVKVSGTVTQMTIALNTWKRVLSLSGMSGGLVYWKVVGTRTNRDPATSEPYSIIPEAAQPVEDETISPSSRTSLPTLYWGNNCNTKFKVWFGNDPDFTKPDMKKKTLSFNMKNPNDNNGLFTKPLTPGQWAAIRKVVGDVSGSTIYWKIESWDGLNRHAGTDVMSFVLGD